MTDTNPRCADEPCRAEGLPYCHCQSCGETGVDLDADGYCSPCATGCLQCGAKGETLDDGTCAYCLFGP